MIDTKRTKPKEAKSRSDGLVTGAFVPVLPCGPEPGGKELGRPLQQSVTSSAQDPAPSRSSSWCGTAGPGSMPPLPTPGRQVRRILGEFPSQPVCAVPAGKEGIHPHLPPYFSKQMAFVSIAAVPKQHKHSD